MTISFLVKKNIIEQENNELIFTFSMVSPFIKLEYFPFPIVLDCLKLIYNPAI